MVLVVNGTNKSVKETYAPAAVINALKRLGWVIPAGEQDAHELLNVLLTTLDEETHKNTRKEMISIIKFVCQYWFCRRVVCLTLWE